MFFLQANCESSPAVTMTQKKWGYRDLCCKCTKRFSTVKMLILLLLLFSINSCFSISQVQIVKFFLLSLALLQNNGDNEIFQCCEWLAYFR